MKLRHLILLALGASISSAQVVGPPVEASVAQTAAGTQGAPYYISPRRLAGSPFVLPTQTGNAGKFLTTDGTTASWASVTVPTAANPTGTISSTVGSFTNGVATTFMRSDAAPTLPATIAGLNSITSAALSNLTLATTSSGITSVTFASATGIPTFGTSVIAGPSTLDSPIFIGAIANITNRGMIDFGGSNHNDGAYYGISGSTNGVVVNAGGGGITLNTQNATNIVFKTTATERGRFSSGGNLLLGGTTDGTGQLQLLSTAGTSASGITYGADSSTYRVSTGRISAVDAASGSSAFIDFRWAGTVKGYAGMVGDANLSLNSVAGSVIIQSNNQNALTLDSSQNATFAGNVTLTAGDVLPGTDNNHNIGSASKRWSSLYVGSGTASFATTISTYNGIATAGNGVASIQGAGRATAQTAANSSIATYTVGAADASFIVSANVLVTTATAHSFSIECAYTDEGSTARTVTFNVQQLGGTLVTAITNVTGAGPYEGVPLHIRAKASTSITIRTNAGGTYTTVTYNAEGVIQKLQ